MHTQGQLAPQRGNAGGRAGAARLLLVVADGVRPDVLRDELTRGNTPALAALVERGGLHDVSSTFPSVTGPAYVPFLTGRHPAQAGLPGLRWFDRARTLKWTRTQTRSYAGIDIWHADRDLRADVPTLLELASPSLAAMSMFARGASHGHVGRSVLWMLRAAPVHFRGDTRAWRALEHACTRDFLRRFARVRPRFSVLAITSPDKFSHALGHDAEAVRESIRDIDAAVRRAQEIAARDRWDTPLHVWLVGDHGHAPVARHDDLHGWLESRGMRVLAHPTLGVRRPDVALMVGGNAMAHLYLDPLERTRRWWPAHAPTRQSLLDALLLRDSVGLVAIAHDAHVVRVASRGEGTAEIRRVDARGTSRWSYLPCDGDPLHLGGAHHALDAHDAWDATRHSPFPDSIVQLAATVPAPRSGDILVSAADGWDLRERYEPVPHVSTHGALLRAQMHVPLIVDVQAQREPQRTTDVFPSALDLLALPAEGGVEGRSFLRPAAS